MLFDQVVSKNTEDHEIKKDPPGNQIFVEIPTHFFPTSVQQNFAQVCSWAEI